MEPSAANHGTAILPAWLGGLFLLVGLSLGLAWLVRRAGVPGAAAVGGVLAGLALGPGVLGRVAPAMHDRMFGAAPEELAAWRAAERAIEATQFAAAQAEVDPASASGQVEVLAREADARRAAWSTAVERARRPFLALAFILAAAVVLVSGLARDGDGARPDGAAGRGLLLGAWNACLPAALVAVGLRWLGEPAWSPTMLATMAAVAAGAWPLATGERDALRAALPHTLASLRPAAMIANVAAVALLVAGAIVASHPLATVGAAGLAAALVLGPALARIVPGDRLALSVLALLVPPLAALATIRIEPFLDPRWSLLILLALVAEDGRWLAGTLGSWLPGGHTFGQAMTIGLAAIPAGPMMLAMAAIGLEAGFLAPPAGAGLVAGVLLIEVLAPIRSRFAADLARGGPGGDDRTGP